MSILNSGGGELGTVSLEEWLVQQLKAWFRREAPRIHRDEGTGEFIIHLHGPAEISADEDDRRYLSAEIEERTLHESVSGPIEEKVEVT